MRECESLNYKNYLDIQKDDDYLSLYKYYSTNTIYDVLRKRRSETTHSSFLRWLLDKDGNHGLNELPIRRFIQTVLLIKEKVYDNYKDYYFNGDSKDISNLLSKENAELCDYLKMGNYTILEMAVDNEIVLTKNSRADLVVFIRIRIKNEIKYLYILIENKVSSEEGTDENGAQTQTEKYIESIKTGFENSIKNIERKTKKAVAIPEEKEEAVNYEKIEKRTRKLFVFLNPGSTSDIKEAVKNKASKASTKVNNLIPVSNKFISLNYQYLMDGLFEPLNKISDKEETKYRLTEYIRALSFPVIGEIEDSNIGEDDKTTDIPAMAISYFEKEKAINLFRKYKEIIWNIILEASDDNLNSADNDFWMTLAQLYLKIDWKTIMKKTEEDKEDYEKGREDYEKALDNISDIFKKRKEFYSLIRVNQIDYLVKFRSQLKKGNSLGAAGYTMTYYWIKKHEKNDITSILSKKNIKLSRCWLKYEEETFMPIDDVMKTCEDNRMFEHWVSHFFVRDYGEKLEKYAGSNTKYSHIDLDELKSLDDTWKNETFPPIEINNSEQIFVSRYWTQNDVEIMVKALDLNCCINEDRNKVSEIIDMSEIFDNETFEKKFKIVERI